MCLCSCKIHEAEETHFSPASEGLWRLNAIARDVGFGSVTFQGLSESFVCGTAVL